MDIVRIIDSVSNRKDEDSEARSMYYPRVIALLYDQPAAVQWSTIGVQA
jgi:hypothetical protein